MQITCHVFNYVFQILVFQFGNVSCDYKMHTGILTYFLAKMTRYHLPVLPPPIFSPRISAIPMTHPDWCRGARAPCGYASAGASIPI